MRPLTMMQAGWRADTQRGEFLTFRNCKGGLLSTDPAYALKVSGKTDGDLCVKAGSSVLCAGKNLWPHGNVRVEGQRGNFLLHVPAGTYTLSARVRSTDTHANSCLVYINNGGFIACGILREEDAKGADRRTACTFALSGDPANFSFYASNNHANSENDLAFFEDIMLEFGSQTTAYEPYAATEITVPCDLCEGDVWYPALGRVERAGGAVESYPAQNLTAVTGTSVVWQSSSDLPATLETTMLVRR